MFEALPDQPLDNGPIRTIIIPTSTIGMNSHSYCNIWAFLKIGNQKCMVYWIIAIHGLYWMIWRGPSFGKPPYEGMNEYGPSLTTNDSSWFSRHQSYQLTKKPWPPFFINLPIVSIKNLWWSWVNPSLTNPLVTAITNHRHNEPPCGRHIADNEAHPFSEDDFWRGAESRTGSSLWFCRVGPPRGLLT